MKMFVVLIVSSLLFAGTASAFDGEISFSYYNNATYRAYPDGGNTEGSALIEVGHEIGRFRAFTSINTRIDNLNADVGMHAASARYTIGVERIFKNGIFIGVEHMCWHPIDRDGRGKGQVEQYDLIKVGVRFGHSHLKQR